MEDVLPLALGPERPAACIDESCKHPAGEARAPLPDKPGQPQQRDDEYAGRGIAEIFMEREPPSGRRHVAVTERRTRKDWTRPIGAMPDESRSEARKAGLTMDNVDRRAVASP